VLEKCGYGYGEDWHSHGALLRAARLIERHSTKESFRAEILTALADNLTSERGGFSRNGAELFQEVFPRICTDDELITIADHVEDFLGHISQRTPPDRSWHCQAMPPREAVLTLQSRCLAHPVNAISFGAQRGILTLLRSTQLALPDVEFLCRSVADHPGRLMGLLAVFRAAAAGMPKSVRLALPWLRETANARHFGVQNECRLIVSELGETLESRSVRHPELMRNFANRPIQAEAAVFGDEATATSSLPAAHDAESFAFLHMFEINCLARAAGIDVEFVLQRVYEICLSQYRDSSTKTAEDALRFRLENAGLRINYQRPRAFAIEHAIHQAAAELVDAGRIKEEWSNRRVPVIRISDPLLLSLEPDAMPAGIPAFHPPDPFGGEKEKWILECDAGQAAFDQLICREIENCIVLAESTCFQTGRSGLSERRMSNLWLTHTDPLSDEPLLPSSTRTYAAQYETAMSNEPAFAVQHPYTLSSRSPHHDWIALNANCAIAAGFNVEPSRLLGWTDGVDHVWVIRWMSGSPLVTPRENVRADGWLLVGTPGTIEKLCPESETPVRRCSVSRGSQGGSECHWAESVDIPSRGQS